MAANNLAYNVYDKQTSALKRNPFLVALKGVEHGRLVMATPENNILEFSGRREGPEAHLLLNDWQVLDDLIARGEIGFAENYIDNKCDSDDLASLLTFSLLNSPTLERFFHGKPLYALWLRLKNTLRGNSLNGSRKNIMAHYDLGNDFYSLWLDEGMTYSCALFDGNESRSLEEAQAAKYRRILDKLSTKPGDHILDIGCGWGGFAEAAAKEGLRVTAITISKEQANYARERIRKAKLDNLVLVEIADYREIKGKFDHVVSIGMLEHVGEQYWLAYFDIIKNALKSGGKAMIQSITLDCLLFEELGSATGFIEHYIFPGGMLPSKSRFCMNAEKVGLKCREMFAFGEDYARTLKHWLYRFELNRDKVIALGFDESFIRLWRFYLSSCIASFLSKRSDVMQAELVHS